MNAKYFWISDTVLLPVWYINLMSSIKFANFVVSVDRFEVTSSTLVTANDKQFFFSKVGAFQLPSAASYIEEPLCRHLTVYLEHRLRCTMSILALRQSKRSLELGVNRTAESFPLSFVIQFPLSWKTKKNCLIYYTLNYTCELDFSFAWFCSISSQWNGRKY